MKKGGKWYSRGNSKEGGEEGEEEDAVVRDILGAEEGLELRLRLRLKVEYSKIK